MIAFAGTMELAVRRMYLVQTYMGILSKGNVVRLQPQVDYVEIRGGISIPGRPFIRPLLGVG